MVSKHLIPVTKQSHRNYQYHTSTLILLEVIIVKMHCSYIILYHICVLGTTVK